MHQQPRQERFARRNGFAKVEHTIIEMLVKIAGPLPFVIFSIISSRGRSAVKATALPESRTGSWPEF